MTRTITAYFDNHTEAQAACDRLREAGISPTDMTIHHASSSETATTAELENKGFWASLGDLFMPDEDRYAYSEGIRRGGSVLTVRADDFEFDIVSDILEDAGSVDLDTKEAEWRAQGWNGYNTSSADKTPNDVTDNLLGAGAGTMSDTTTGKTYTTPGVVSEDENYIPVAEEQLRVGKREVDHGRVRIRSYVVETPVDEHVSLREESIHLERNPVDRAAASADNLFQERTIEAEEHSEEAVVTKEARVVEEVRLNKNVIEREQVISDTVRHTEIEVEDERTDAAQSNDERARQDRDS